MAALVAPAILAGLSLPALADQPDGVVCDPITHICTVRIQHGSHGGGKGSGGGGVGFGSAVCKLGSETVPCYDPNFGWWNASDHCYYKALTPPPRTPAEAAAYGLAWHPPGDGAYYWSTCPGGLGTGGGATWLATPPPGYGGVNVWALVQQALKLLRMAPPRIGISPPPTKPSIVGVYDWLWIERTPTSWGRQSVTAAVPGASVTATATATQVVWDMGNGDSLTCTTAGTPWVPGDPANSASGCSYVYRHRGSFRVTATTTFQVGWSGTGLASSATGQTQITLSSSVPLTVDELQAINRVG